MKKRFLSIILTILIVLMLFPLISSANSSYTDWTDETKLPTKAGAYKLTCDVNITNTVTIGAWSGSNTTVTLDLNGHTVRFDGSSAKIYVQNTGTLIIEDSAGNGLMTNAGTNQYIIHAKGNCQIEGGTLENTLQNGKALYIQGETKEATCTLNGGTILNSYDRSGRAVVVGSKATFTMNGGKVENRATGTAGTVPAIQGGNIKITGGTIDSAGTGIDSNGTIVEITGGTIEADWFAFKTRYAVIDPAEGKTVNISAGKAILNSLSAPSSGKGNQIIGGNFDAPELVAKNYSLDASNAEIYGGTYTNGNIPMDLTGYLDDATVDSNGKVTCSHTETYEEGATQATCTSEGRTADIICSNCKKTVTEGTTIPMEQHTHGEWKIDKEATCTEKGSRYKECSCGDKVTEEISATGHSFENGKCTVCTAIDPDYVDPEKEDEEKKGEVELPKEVANTEKVEEMLLKELAENEEFAELIKNNNVTVKLDFDKVEEKDIPAEDKKEIEAAAGEKSKDIKIAKFIDITINVKKDGTIVDNLETVEEAITFKVKIPTNLPKPAEGYSRTYYIVRNHNGKIEFLDTKVSGDELEFSSNLFSTYAIAYSDVENSIEVPSTQEPSEDKDKTPNMGATDVVLYASIIVAIISLAGIVMVKKYTK